MQRIGITVVACCALGVLAAWAADKEVVYVDLEPHANQKLNENFHDGREGNNLAELPSGTQTFAGVRFKIADGLIQLAGQVVKDKPEKVQGIKVGRAFSKLHILHATGYGGGPNTEGNPLFVEDDTIIGQYTVRYEDKSEEIIEIAYGKDVRDWWFSQTEKGVTRGKVAWIGDNALAKQTDMGVRLYLTTWTNPSPRKKVAAIDYLSTNQTAAAPFCVAITAETE